MDANSSYHSTGLRYTRIKKNNKPLNSPFIEFNKTNSNFYVKKIFDSIINNWPTWLISFIIIIYSAYEINKFVNSVSVSNEKKIYLITTQLNDLEDKFDKFKLQINKIENLNFETTNKVNFEENVHFQNQIENSILDNLKETVSKLVDQKLEALLTEEFFSNHLKLFNDKIFNYYIENFDTIFEKKIKTKSNFNSTHVNELIRNQFENFFLEKETKPDYASELNDAKLIDVSPTYVDPSTFRLFNLPLWSSSSPPNRIIKRACDVFELSIKPWKMQGNNGFFKIQISKAITPTSFVYEHFIINSILEENQLKCAPRIFRVFGYKNLDSVKSIALGKFTVEIDNINHSEFFFENKSKEKISVLQFNIEDNYGNPNYTCIQRIKIH